MQAMICDSEKKVKTFQKEVAPNLQDQIEAVLLTKPLEAAYARHPNVRIAQAASRRDLSLESAELKRKLPP
jgi:hypothetical protein